MPKGSFTSSGRQSSNHQAIGGGADARTGLGYGTLTPQFDKQRSLGSQFPYYEKEEETDDIEDEDDVDQETVDDVSTKYRKYQPSDFGRAAGSDPFYFAGGNTKLSDCFWRTDKVLAEVAAFRNSMAPISHKQLYPGAQAGLSAGPSFTAPGSGGTNYRRTGTLNGWSHAPDPIKYSNANLRTPDDVDKELDQESEEHILTLKDLASKKMSRNGEVKKVDNI